MKFLKQFSKKKSPFGLVGIKNSWKYEKDLIIIFNIRNTFVPIGLLGNYFIPQVVKVDFMQIIIIDKV